MLLLLLPGAMHSIQYRRQQIQIAGLLREMLGSMYGPWLWQRL